MTRSLPHGIVRRVCWPVLLCALPASGAWAGDQPADAAASSSSSSSSSSSAEVVISTENFDPRQLEKEIVPQFVKTHGAPTPYIEQMTRWREPVCPEVAGVNAELAATVTGQIFAAAQAAGAPNHGAGQKCTSNIAILFTNEPQQLLDSIEKDHAPLLGSGRVKGDTTFSRAIQVWYLTGTRQLSGPGSPSAQVMGAPGAAQGQTSSMGMGGMSRGGMGTGMGMGMNNGAAMPPPSAPSILSNMPPPPSNSVVPDPAWDNSGAPTGSGFSRLSQQWRSELLHVTIIVDGQKLNGMSLQVLSDYIALLALTRMTALDTCNPLPSIVDLFAAGCADRAKPAALSGADAAFLKALYASDLDGRIGSEQSEVNKRMLAALKKQPH